MRRAFRGPLGTVALSLLLSVAGATAARGQSLLSAGGLGTPVDPIGARGRALGSVGVGLPAGTILPGDPAAAVGVPLPTVIGTLQPTVGTTEGLGPDVDLTTTRFPLFGLAYPVAEDKVITLTVGSFLDQNWALEVDGSVPLAGETVDVTDAFTSEGGVSTIQAGWGQAVSENLSVGASAGLHLGELTRTFIRTFDTVGVGGDVESFSQTRRWRLSGPTATLGLAAEPVPALRASASLTWSGTLTAEADEESGEETREFSMPLELRLGTSVSLASDLFAHAGLSYADWAETGRDLSSGTSRGGALAVGGGMEWLGLSMLGRTIPLRLGIRRSELPFHFAGSAATELTFSGGVGMNLVESEDGIPLAALDFAVEQGDREAGSLTESFTRFSASLRVSGN